MAPLVITVPSGVKLMVNDVELAKAVILDCLTRPHTFEYPQLAPTQSASPSFASRKSVTTRSDLETHTSFDVGKPATRNATRSDFMPDSRKTASIQSSSRKSAISAAKSAARSDLMPDLEKLHRSSLHRGSLLALQEVPREV